MKSRSYAMWGCVFAIATAVLIVCSYLVKSHKLGVENYRGSINMFGWLGLICLGLMFIMFMAAMIKDDHGNR